MDTIKKVESVMASIVAVRIIFLLLNYSKLIVSTPKNWTRSLLNLMTLLTRLTE